MPESYASFTFYTKGLKPLWSTSQVLYAQWVRTVNSLGSATVELPQKVHTLDKLLSSRVMVIDTHDFRGSPNLETAWFLTAVREIPMSEGRASFYRLEFEDALTLFDNRLIPFRADFPYGSEPRTRINDIGTRGLEQVYDVSIGLLAGPNRILEPLITTKAPVTSVAPVVTKEIPWKRALTTLKQIAKTCRDQGSPVYFDLVAQNLGNGINLTFTTYADQRGADRTSQVITSDDPQFVLTEFAHSFKIPNVAYVGGSGRGQNRIVAEVVHPNTDSIERVELFRAAQSSNLDLLVDEGSHLVNNTAGRTVLAGRLIGSLGATFGFGDRITLSHQDLLVPSEISSVRYTLDNQHLQREVIARSIE